MCVLSLVPCWVSKGWALFSQLPFLRDLQPFPSPLTTHGARSRFFPLKNTSVCKNTLQFAERFKSYGREVTGKYRRWMRNSWFILLWQRSRRCGSRSQIYHWFALWPWTSHSTSFCLRFSSRSLALELISSPRRAGSTSCLRRRICSRRPRHRSVRRCDLRVGTAPRVAERWGHQVLGDK